jgi:transcriptional regulator with XRE-family HTH domain
MTQTGRALSFGETVRSLREQKKITLRKFADMVGITPTYLSKIERNEFDPPAEDKIRTIAKLLDQDVDLLLALAGKVSSDLGDIIQKHPREIAAFLRTAKTLSARDIEKLTKKIEENKR